MCQKHYQRRRRHGDPNVVKRSPTRFAEKQPCALDECDEQVQVRGLCRRHYNAWQNSPAFLPAPKRTGGPCAVTGCANRAEVAAICWTHYYRQRRYGDVLEHLPVGWIVQPPPPCSTEGCDRAQVGRGRCITHYGAIGGWTLDDLSTSAVSDTTDWVAIISGDPCSYCGGPMEHVDHVVARSLGGPDHWTNYAPTCQWCNMSKRVNSVLGFMLKRLEAGDELHVGTSRSTRSSGAGQQMAV